MSMQMTTSSDSTARFPGGSEGGLHTMRPAVITIATVVFACALAVSRNDMGSVGGPMALFFIFLIAAPCLGLYEAWTKKRGPFSWIVNIVVSLIGGICGILLASMVNEAMIMLVQPEGALVVTRHPLLYAGLACMVGGLLLGSWTALRIVNRFR